MSVDRCEMCDVYRAVGVAQMEQNNSLRSENSLLRLRLEKAESILGHVHRSYGVRAAEKGWYPYFMVGDFLAEKTPQGGSDPCSGT
jgi:hypothetical protein